MKLKFYLRGLGVGIVFTALIFSFIIVPKYKLTDSEIRNRARQLGMVDKAPTPTSDMSVIKNTGTPSPTPTATPSATPAETPALTGDPEITPETTDAPSSSPAPTDTGEPSPSATSTPTPTATSTPVPTATNTPSPTPTSAPSSTPLPTATTAPSPTPTSAPTNTPSPVPTSGPIVDGQEIIIQVTSGMSSELLCQKLLEAGLITDAHDFDLYLNLNGYDKRIQVGTFKLKKGMTYEQIAKIVAR